MSKSSRIAAFALIVALGTAFYGARPALANGAASTRNIIFGAAAAAGTLLIINHNRKVHEKYAEDARRQANVEAQRNNLAAALSDERQAYQHQVAINQEYKHEVAIQHDAIVKLRQQVAQTDRHGFAVPVALTNAKASSKAAAVPSNAVAYGWGAL
ncbi:MAG: hypothetical protein ACREM8_01025 [Vulcanimicrobiaceae bacterium]